VAATITLSQAELKRRGDLAYNNRTYTVFLADNSTAGLDEEDTAALWLEEELATANGYAAVTGTIDNASGAYNATTARYEFPAIVAVFTATGTGFTYDTVVLRIGTSTSIVGTLVEDPPITLLAGQSKSYRIILGQDD
jgi:hypothetical protein